VQIWNLDKPKGVTLGRPLRVLLRVRLTRTGAVYPWHLGEKKPSYTAFEACMTAWWPCYLWICHSVPATFNETTADLYPSNGASFIISSRNSSACFLDWNWLLFGTVPYPVIKNAVSSFALTVIIHVALGMFYPCVNMRRISTSDNFTSS